MMKGGDGVSCETILGFTRSQNFCILSIRRIQMFMDEEGTTLATEIFKELKASARRWFIAFLLMLGVEICTIGGFLWYISLPTDEGVIVENDDGNASYVGGDVGGDVNNGKNNGLQKEGQKETETEIKQNG